MSTKKPSQRPHGASAAPPGSLAGDRLKQLVVDTVAGKVQAKADKHSETINRFAPVAYDALDLWTRVEPGPRRPRFTREQIASAAMRIADAEGIDALSMRRLAAELGAGTMTLYHYVRTKDELLALVTDAVMAEILLPADQLPSDWRAAMRAIAQSSRAALLRHPWVFDIVDDPTIGPNGVRHFDQSLQAVASLPGTLTDKLDVIFAVDEYVFGHCLNAREGNARREVVRTDPVADRAMMHYVAGLARKGDYPQLSSLIAEHGIDALWNRVAEYGRDDSRFDRNLDRFLDGLASDLAG